MIKKILALSFLCISANAMANCQTGNVYTDISCLEKQNASVKSSMAKEYKSLSNMLDANGKARLSKSQKSWTVYRDEQCKLLDIASSMAQGAGAELAHISCIADMNQKRLTEIRRTAKEIAGE